MFKYKRLLLDFGLGEELADGDVNDVAEESLPTTIRVISEEQVTDNRSSNGWLHHRNGTACIASMNAAKASARVLS